MKKSVLIVLLSFGTFILVTGSLNLISRSSAVTAGKSAGPADFNMQQDTARKATYTCPMHAEIIKDKAGKCPKCGMNLVVKDVNKEVFTCPMHPEVKKDKSGKCPKCGMTLVKKDPEEKTDSGKF